MRPACDYCHEHLPAHQRWCRYYEGHDPDSLRPRLWLHSGYIVSGSITASHIHVGRLSL